MKGSRSAGFRSPDVDAPPSGLHDPFPRAGQVILNDVAAGRTVVIHCRGGIGRPASWPRRAVALGHPPGEAIELVRSARPGAVEVTVQEEWVEAVAARLKSEPASWWRDRTTTGNDTGELMSGSDSARLSPIHRI